LRIDLHTHSTASDGTTSPADLVTAAAAAGLDVVALTDHDTTAGWAEATAALPAGLTLVPGAELSCEYRRDGEEPIALHLLAYLFDPTEPVFAAERRRIRDSRLHRGRRIVDNLRADGYPVSWEEVLGYADGGTVGRPHVARALVAHGLVGSVDEAFSPAWLGSEGRYFAEKEHSDARDAIGMVRAAGGAPVIAHPLARRRERVIDQAAIAELATAGLIGLEVDHPDQDAATRRELRDLAAALDLVVTGSSDYHGSNKVTPIGAETTAPPEYERLVHAATGSTPVTVT
jgi:3',5'-nucleoside bisphosphate phosphatase